MDIELDHIESSEDYEEYGLDARRQNSYERVQDHVYRGRFELDTIYKRYTHELSSNQMKTRNNYSQLDILKQIFEQLCDTENRYLSKDKFCYFVAEKLTGLEPVDLDGPLLLFNIICWHAFFPFPESQTETGIPCVDEDAFVRAIALLTLNPPPQYGPDYSAAKHNVISGAWGPHAGFFITIRGKDTSDFLRRLFRSLAAEDVTNTSHVTTIPVPRFIMYEEHVENGSDQQIVVMEKEREVTVDVQDVLSEYPPEKHSRSVARPFRESYEPVLATLPHHLYDLSQLCVPTRRILVLVRYFETLPQITGRIDIPNTLPHLIASLEKFGDDGKVNWMIFNDLMTKYARLVSEILSEISGTFSVPLNETLSQEL